MIDRHPSSMQLWPDDMKGPKYHKKPEAIWVKTDEEAMVILRGRKVTFTSFDNDLETELNGHDVAAEIERPALERKILMSLCAVHLSNSVGEAEITTAMTSAERCSDGSTQVTSTQIHVGLEIGTSKICVCVSEAMSDGMLRILGVGEAPSRGVRKGEIVDPDAASECIRMAIHSAEASSGMKIKKVSVAITGSHLKSFISRASLIVPKNGHEITIEEIGRVREMARKVPLPFDQLLLRSIQGEVSLCGLNQERDNQATRLEAICHIIHGSKSRIQRTLDCLESLQLEVVNLVPNSLASSSALFFPRGKSSEVLVIDLGGGTTDYGLTSGGTFQLSGVLAVGGEHISNDISIGLRLPIAKAESLKIEAGETNHLVKSTGETITLKRDHGLRDYKIDRMSLNTIIHLRIREIFEQIRDEIVSSCENGTEGTHLEKIDEVILTGGGSKLAGITSVAGEVFKHPVMLGHARTVSGMNHIIENPAFTTLIGITKFAMKATPNSSVLNDCKKKPIEKPEPKSEFSTNAEYLTALRKERDPGKNFSRDGSKDLDVPTFLRKGTEGMKLKHAIKLYEMTSSLLAPLSIEFHGIRISEPAIVVVPLIVAAIYFSIASFVWLYRDAEERGKKGWTALLLVLLTGWPISFLWWFWLRPKGERHPINWKLLQSTPNRSRDSGRAIVFVQMRITARPKKEPESPRNALTTRNEKPLVNS